MSSIIKNEKKDNLWLTMEQDNNGMYRIELLITYNDCDYYTIKGCRTSDKKKAESEYKHYKKTFDVLLKN